MPTRPQIEITREELERAEIPLNHVLIKITRRAEGLRTNAGVTIGFNEDVVYAEGDDSHSANLAENVGYVTKVPQGLYFNPEDPKSMDWETGMELQIGDLCFFSLIEAKNSVQLICEGELYKSIPYSDCYVAKRISERVPVDYEYSDNYGRVLYAKAEFIIPLNGFVLCEPVMRAKLSDLDHFSPDEVDKTKGIIRFIGSARNRYLRDNYSHIDDLRVGYEVLFDPKSSPFYLERLGMTAIFDNGRQYWVIPRRKIVMVINR